MKRILTLLLLAVNALLGAPTVDAAVYHARGFVTDSVSGEPIPFAAIEAKDAFTKVLADENGYFRIDTPRSFSMIEVSAIGYSPSTVEVDNNNSRDVRVRLHASGISLGEVTAKPKKEHYTKKDNPAVALMRKIKEGGSRTDPRRNSYYGYDQYDRITLAINNVTDSDVIIKRFPHLANYIDTSDVTHNPILNISVKEKFATVNNRLSPRSTKTYITGIRRRGVDDVFDQQSIQTFLEDVLREIDVYDNDINILQNRFVSPLSRIAPDFYKFYIDTVASAASPDEKRQVLKFVPRTAASFGFTGRLYLAPGDTTMFIERIEMNVPHNINLNFIDHLYITQEFERAPDGSRLKTLDDLTLEMNFFGMKMYTRRNTAYAAHSFEPVADGTFEGGPPVEEMKGAGSRTDEFWASHRLIPVTDSEDHMHLMVEELRRNKLYYWGEKILHALTSGYVGTGKPSKIDIGPINTFLSGNTLEGLRMKFGGITTSAFSPRWFFRGYGAYGTRDHKWKYLAEAEYSFHDKRIHAREFPVHSLMLTSKYDVDMLGQHYMFTNPDNFVLSIKRCKDTQITYKRENKLTYTLELYNNFSLKATAGSRQQIASRLMHFVDGYGRNFNSYTENFVGIELRYAPGERFFQTRSQRIPVNFDAPVIVLSHTVAPRGLGSTRFTLNVTELSFQKRIWFSAFGYLDMIFRGGHVWSSVPYPSLLIPNANLSYTIQPESFTLMNAMEFLNDSYGSWDLTYWANGAIFNYIPYLKKLKLREVVSFKGLCGHLSRKNRPWLDPELFRFPEVAHTRLMTATPYMEISAGIDNIFKVLRLDYVWRLTYRHDYAAPLGGLRVALHVTF